MADHTVLLCHQLKSTWNVGCIWNFEGGAFDGDIYYATAGARSISGNISRLVDLCTGMLSPIIHLQVRRLMTFLTGNSGFVLLRNELHHPTSILCRSDFLNGKDIPAIIGTVQRYRCCQPAILNPATPPGLLKISSFDCLHGCT
jgi:hypothetical protein